MSSKKRKKSASTSKQKKAVKKTAAAASKSKAVVIIAVIAVIIIGGVLLADYFIGFIGLFRHDNEDYLTGELTVHFMELGNKHNGDSTLIKAGDTEILIDGGSIQSSAETLTAYINKYCTDGILEYVIVTHADSDHISAFVGTKTVPGIFAAFECRTIIDFPLTNKEYGKDSLYTSYVDERDKEVAAGAKHYTALDCYYGKNGAQRVYNIAQDISFSVLYNHFYENKTSDENEYSVCMLLTQGNKNFLFTGDLEEKGEEHLVDKNDLPKCALFKAGHHGSRTSSSDKLLSVIKPDIIAVCCCAGYNQYGANEENIFPSQAFINRAARYTKNIYVTTVAADNAEGYAPMNGNIGVSSDGVDVTVKCSNNDIVLKDTDWFKKNRTWPSYGVT